MNKVALFTLASLVLANTMPVSYAALETVDCATNAVFGQNSCNQCFNGGNVEVGDNKGLLSDVWQNDTSASQFLYKEEQEMPQMIALNGAVWNEVKASSDVDFWQYTSDLEALYSEDDLSYKLEAGSSVKWLESTLGSAYELSSSTGEGNVGLLAYDIAVHDSDESGNVALETTTHRECVLYTGGSAPTPETPVVPETPNLPQTGPEVYILGLVAMTLGLGFVIKMRKAK